MELYQLKTFVTVAEEGLLARAALRLNSSQPAISAHIKALESELGISLFDRTPKGMRLTSAGGQLKIKASTILDAADELRYTASALKNVLTGDIRLGIHTHPKQLRITELLVEFRQSYPDLSLNYLQKMSWQAPGEVVSGNLDAAFIYSQPDDEKIQVELLDQVQLVIVAPVMWQGRLNNASLDDLISFPWVWADKHCPLYKVATSLFAKTGREPEKAVIVDQESAIFKLVSAGAGLSLMPEAKAKEASLAGELYISKIPASKLDLSLIYLKSREGDPVVKAIRDVVSHVWQTKISGRPAESAVY